jgi:1-acyl-sn-glycerol-3-phosphate acyltransferase
MVAALQERIPPFDLDERDPDYIREMLPGAWVLATIWHRAEVRDLANIPDDGPALLVGNHSGGNSSPDTVVLALAFSSWFGVERPFYQLAHDLVTMFPGIGTFLRKFGTIPASHANAERALATGAPVLVYPGGDWEVHRPTWHGHRIDFNGRKGFLRLALQQKVPIVPVVSLGGQETALFLSRGDRLARALGLDRRLRLKVLPISVVFPWGLSIGDFVPRLPLPAKLTMQVLPAIDLVERFGPSPDLDVAYDHVVSTMQDALDGLVAERRLPFLG